MSASTEQSPIFAKTYDLLVWMIPMLTSFPKDQRFRLGARLENSLFAFHECLLRAARVKDKRTALAAADLELERMRFYIRLARDLRMMTFKQYEHAAGMCAEVGRLLGGWLKTLSASDSASTAEEAKASSASAPASPATSTGRARARPAPAAAERGDKR